MCRAMRRDVNLPTDTPMELVARSRARAALCWLSHPAAPDRMRIGCLAAWAEILNGEQTEAAARALVGDGVMAVLAIDRIRRRALPAGLADV